MSYDWMVVLYFFLGGISAGSYIFSVVANYWKQEFKPLAKTGAIIAPVFLALGMLILLLDLGQPLRAWRLFTTFVPTSALSWGVWFLNIFFVLSIIYANGVIKDKSEEVKKVACIGLPFSVLVGTYTGLLLVQSPGRVSWHSPLIPLLFLIGGLISGIALVLIVSIRSDNRFILEKLGRIIAGLLVLEFGLIILEMLTMLNGDAESMRIANSFLFGNYSFLFLVVEILAGLILPLFILFQRHASMTSQTVALSLILILVGIYTMRYLVVIGGQVPTF
jgi:polysulfide reductase chain C